LHQTIPRFFFRSLHIESPLPKLQSSECPTENTNARFSFRSLGRSPSLRPERGICFGHFVARLPGPFPIETLPSDTTEPPLLTAAHDMAEDDVERQVEKPRPAERGVHAIFFIA
jgi:hypothetical protein